MMITKQQLDEKQGVKGKVLPENRVLYEYVTRGPQNKKVGMLVAFKSATVEGFLCFGASLCHRNDEFSAEEAFKKAYGRAMAKSFTPLPDSEAKQFFNFVQRSKQYFRTNNLT